MPLFVGHDDPDFVVGGLEADIGSADVVNDDGVEFLSARVSHVRRRARQCRARRRTRRSAGRGGGARTECGKHVRGTYEREVQFPAGLVLLDLAGARVRPAGSRRRRPPSAVRRTLRSARHTRRRAWRRSPTSTYSMPAARGIVTLAATTVTLAPRRCASCSEREPHAPGGAVADEAHGIDRLARPARGDENGSHRRVRPPLAARSPRRPATPAARAGARSRTPPASPANRCRAQGP